MGLGNNPHQIGELLCWLTISSISKFLLLTKDGTEICGTVIRRYSSIYHQLLRTGSNLELQMRLTSDPLTPSYDSKPADFWTFRNLLHLGVAVNRHVVRFVGVLPPDKCSADDGIN